MFMSFDYKCLKCKDYFERFVKKEERDKQYCETCNEKLVRVPHAVRTTFKFNDK
jgi:putative FmdB family regulatory protein